MVLSSEELLPPLLAPIQTHMATIREAMARTIIPGPITPQATRVAIIAVAAAVLPPLLPLEAAARAACQDLLAVIKSLGRH